MLSRLYLILLPLLGLVPSEVGQTDVSSNYELKCEAGNFSFEPGEELVYKIYYNLNFIWIPAGEVRFNVFSGKDTYEYTAYGTTYPSYEWFYQVNDVYKTIVDKESLLPIYSMRHLQEGGYTLYEEVNYDQSKQEVKVLRGRDKETATERGIVSFESCTNDIISLLYKLRNLDRDAFIDSGEMPISFFMGKDNYDLKLRYLGQERKKIRGMGRLNTLKVSPTLVEGDIFKEGDQMLTWVSDDKNRIPLLVESPLSVGSAKAVLQSYKGLKHPFEQ